MSITIKVARVTALVATPPLTNVFSLTINVARATATKGARGKSHRLRGSLPQAVDLAVCSGQQSVNHQQRQDA